MHFKCDIHISIAIQSILLSWIHSKVLVGPRVVVPTMVVMLPFFHNLDARIHGKLRHKLRAISDAVVALDRQHIKQAAMSSIKQGTQYRKFCTFDVHLDDDIIFQREVANEPRNDIYKWYTPSRKTWNSLAMRPATDHLLWRHSPKVESAICRSCRGGYRCEAGSTNVWRVVCYSKASSYERHVVQLRIGMQVVQLPPENTEHARAHLFEFWVVPSRTR
mmetsp:Transcript_27350/g.43799  ORF Transcript_27350/g.43799 Transcript_27350/m.43799 type:complete len:219 (-) Transcript_27350:596-1252(-)